MAVTKSKKTVPVSRLAKKPKVTVALKPSVSISFLRIGPKEVFLQLMSMAMLYITVISLLMLAFAYVDLKLPDLLNNYSYPQGNLDNIRLSSSMLVVSFPLLLIFPWLMQKNIRQTPQKHEFKLTKWLTYFTLLVSSITLIVDLIILVHRFYSGDLTLAFLLKVLSVLVLAGVVLGYYVWELQSEPYKSKIPAVLAWISSVFVLGMLVLGFVVAGSPAKQREMRMDDQRVNSLTNLQYEILNYWQMKRVLPESLEDLKNDLSGFSLPLDPETQKPYIYKISSPLSFTLCAVFNQPSLSNHYYDPYDGKGENWSHTAGEFCFDRTIDPELYPQPVL